MTATTPADNLMGLSDAAPTSQQVFSTPKFTNIIGNAQPARQSVTSFAQAFQARPQAAGQTAYVVGAPHNATQVLGNHILPGIGRPPAHILPPYQSDFHAADRRIHDLSLQVANATSPSPSAGYSRLFVANQGPARSNENNIIIHEEPPADYWDSNDVHESRRHKIKVGVKETDIKSEAKGCCAKFNRLCKPCCGCPWWLVALLSLLALGGLYKLIQSGFFRGGDSQCQRISNSSNNNFGFSSGSSSSVGQSTSSESSPSNNETNTSKK